MNAPAPTGPRRLTLLFLLAWTSPLTSCEPAATDPAKKVDEGVQPQSTTASRAPAALAGLGNNVAAAATSTTLPPSAPPPASTGTAGASSSKEEAGRRYERIRAFHDALPTKFHDAPEGLSARVDRMTEECRAYLKEHDAARPETGAPAAAETVATKKGATPEGVANDESAAVKKGEVQYVLAKFLFINSEVRKAEWRQQLSMYKGASLLMRTEDMNRRYLEDVVELCRAAKEALPAANTYRPLAFIILGQAASAIKDHDTARETYEQFLAAYGDNEKLREETAKVMVALSVAYRELKEYDKGIALLERAVKEHFASSSYPYFAEGLYKLFLHKGDLDGMERSNRTVRTVFPIKLEDETLKGRMRDTTESLYVFHGFRKGYVQFARGELKTALPTFQAHVAALDAREAEREKTGNQLPPAWRIYRDRSRANVRFLEELGGRPAPHDLDLGSGWATEKHLPLSAARGKTVALVFRRIGDERSASFLEAIHPFCAENPQMEMLVVSYLKSDETIAEDFLSLRTELTELGYEGAAGFDPDTAKKSIFRQFHAMVGSATFYIVDADGKLVWFQQDPRGVDANFCKAILNRVARAG